MAEHSKIEWTDATWQPITGCSVVSPGCTNCYAMKLAGTRMQHHPSRAGLTKQSKAGPVWTGEVRFNEAWLTQPLRWRRPRAVFVCAHGDLFHEAVPDAWIDRVFAVMALAPQHTFQVLTKRAVRMREYLVSRGTHNERGAPAEDIRVCMTALTSTPSRREMAPALKAIPLGKYCASIPWPLPNVWLGISAERQQEADERIPHLLATPAAVRFVSCEPLLGQIDLTRVVATYTNAIIDTLTPWRPCRIGGTKIEYGPPSAVLDWVIVGGESSPHARPMHPDWPRAIRDQCQAARVPFFFKQWGEWLPWSQWHAGIDEDLEQTRFKTMEWSDGAWSDVARPQWSDTFDGDIDDEHCVGGVGKARAGRLLDGREWNEMPEVGVAAHGPSAL